MRILHALICCFLAGFSGLAQNDVKALVGGTLIDGFGSTPIPNSVILIEGERIKAVGTVETLKVPPGAEVISTEGMSVLPGLWESIIMLNGATSSSSQMM